MRRIRILGVVVMAWLSLGSCNYDLDVGDCLVRCRSDSDCLGGTQCGPEGLCAPAGMTCAIDNSDAAAAGACGAGCTAGQVCCMAPLSCANTCVSDCRLLPCLGGLVCNTASGLCLPGAPTGGAGGAQGTGGAGGMMTMNTGGAGAGTGGAGGMSIPPGGAGGLVGGLGGTASTAGMGGVMMNTGGAGGTPGNLCGSTVCSASQVCCGAEFPCKDTCVPDCTVTQLCGRVGDVCCKEGACKGLCMPDCRKTPCMGMAVCNQTTGVCAPR